MGIVESPARRKRNAKRKRRKAQSNVAKSGPTTVTKMSTGEHLGTIPNTKKVRRRGNVATTKPKKLQTQTGEKTKKSEISEIRNNQKSRNHIGIKRVAPPKKRSKNKYRWRKGNSPVTQRLIDQVRADKRSYSRIGKDARLSREMVKLIKEGANPQNQAAHVTQ